LKSAVFVLLIFAQATPATAQDTFDPIGRLVETGRYSGRDSLIGRDGTGRPVCFRREQGDTHQLDIGIGHMGAFVRLETPEPRDAMPKPPVRVYAGAEEIRNERATGRFRQLTTFVGDIVYAVPDRARAGFTLLASPDPAGFLAVVAEARANFLVVEQRDGRVRDYVAVYEFGPAAMQALLACLKNRID